MLSYCDNTDEALAGMLRRGGAGSSTTADHLQVLDDVITALPPKYRRRLMVTVDGAGASHGLLARLDKLAARPGPQLIYSVGWDLGGRERDAIRLAPQEAWQVAIDHRGRGPGAPRRRGLRGPLLHACAVLGRGSARMPGHQDGAAPAGGSGGYAQVIMPGDHR